MPRQLFLSIVTALILAWTTPHAGAATLEEAQALIDGGRPEEAADVLEGLAEAGNAQAQTLLADMFRDGRGVRRNAISACYWYEEAAKQGISVAQVEAGLCHLEGRNGEPSNYRTGAQWLRSAVDSGHVAALCPFGQLLIFGRGVVQNIDEGVALCTRAAKAGNVRAQASLGELYLNGAAGLGRDAEGAAWIGKAAAVGDAASQYNMGQLLWRGRGVEQDQMKAQSYIAAAAQQGHGEAQFWLGRHLVRVAQRPDGTVQPYEAAAAYYWLQLAERHEIEPEDQAQATEWLTELRRGLDDKVVKMVDDKVAEWQPRRPEDSIVEPKAPAAEQPVAR